MTIDSLQESIRIAPFVLPIVLMAFALHEMAHAYVATWFGDPTPAQHGRRTLNPIPHLDPLGTAMLVISFFLFGSPMGFAVTPVNESRMRKPRLHGALVSLAGPVTNVILCVIWLALLFWVGTFVDGDSFTLGNTSTPLLIEICVYGASFNAFLAVFNMLPIPPLDGGRIVGKLMKPDLGREWDKIGEYGIFIIIGLALLGGQQFAAFIGALQDYVLRFASWFVGLFGVSNPFLG